MLAAQAFRPEDALKPGGRESMFRTSIRALLLTALVLATAVAAAGQAGAANRQDDPCKTREPTMLDKLPEWRCVGLAKFHDPSVEPKELEATDDKPTTR